MTPAKLLGLEKERWRVLEMQALPIDVQTWVYINSHRDPGEKDKDGIVIRPPAPPIPLDKVRTRYLPDKPKTSAAEDKSWDYSLLGAKASRAMFEQWAGHKVPTLFVPNKKET